MFLYEWILRTGDQYATNNTRQNLLLLFAGGTTGIYIIFFKMKILLTFQSKIQWIFRDFFETIGHF